MSPDTAWMDTATLCQRLQVSRTTLHRLKIQGLLREKTHWVRKNPASHQGAMLWHGPKVMAVLRP